MALKSYKLDFGDTSSLQWVSPLKEFDLDGFIINIRLYYNVINNGIYMNIYDQYENILLYGVKLVPNVNLLLGIEYKFDKKKALIVFSSIKGKEKEDVTVENFGKEMFMYYATEENV